MSPAAAGAEPLARRLTRATAVLAEAGVASPRVDAELLAAHAAGTDRGGLQRLVLLGGGWSDEQTARFEALVAERARRVPVQHLTGRAAFRGIELAVGPGVFLPRPETELLAGAAVEALRAVGARERRATTAVDLCTGSAAVPLALVDEVDDVRVAAVELDPMAHAWAGRNVDALGDGRVTLVRGDVADAVELLREAWPDGLGDLDGRGRDGGVDVVTANPPYIPAAAVPVDPEVAEHDPALALYGGEDGLDVLRVCVRVAARLLRPGGLLLLEHAEPQCDGVAAVLARAGGWTDVRHHDDLTGRPRSTSARRAGSDRVGDCTP